MKSLKKLNLTLGPVMAWPEILDIGAQDVPYFRNQMFSDIMLENESMIKRILRTPDNYRCVVLTGSGTHGMEASITNFAQKDDHLLIIVGGKFGGRFSEIADCFGIQHTEINVGFGKVVTKEMLDEYQAKIDSGTKFTHLYVNLDETSTGTLYDLKMLSEFAKKNNLLFVVDAISAFLADEIDLSKTPIDVLIISSQKALALPPGISMLVLSEKAINKKTDIPVYYASVKMALDNSWRGQTPFTPAVQIILQLNARLKECIKNDTVTQTKKISAIIRNRMKEKKSIRYLVPEKVSKYIYEELNYFDIKRIKKDLKEKLSKNRYEHSLRVANYCKRLAQIYKADENKAYLSGLVHDCAKNLEEYYMLNKKVNSDIILDIEEKNNPKIQHAPIGAAVCKNLYGISDNEIISAVRYHTTARENMSLIEKILFISDKIEPNREYDTVEELRKIADYDIDKSIIKFLNDSFEYLEKNSQKIHPLSVKARDYLVNTR